MRKVAGGEASAIPNSTFIGHSVRQPATNPMILKEDFEVEELSESDLDKVWQDLQDEREALDNTEYQSISESLDEIIEQMTHIMAQSGGEESDLRQTIRDQLSNVEVTPRDDPGRIRREGPI